MKDTPTTIREVASRAGVSIATVSRAMNGKSVAVDTRQRILRVAGELGYVPMVPPPANTRRRIPAGVHLVLCHLKNTPQALPASSFQMQLIEGIQREAARQGPIRCQLSAWMHEADPHEQLYHLMDTPATILIGNSDREMVELLLQHNRTVVLADHEHPGLAVDCVLSDDFEAGMKAAEYLLERGHEDIGWFCTLSGIGAWQRRLDGVQARLSRDDLRIAPRHRRFVQAVPPVDDALLEANARDWLDAGDLPTAVICPNGEEAVLLKNILDERGLLIGRDISLVTFDNSDLTRSVRPELTRLATFPEEIGRQAMRQLLMRLGDDEQAPLLPQKTVLPIQLIEGQSVRNVADECIHRNPQTEELQPSLPQQRRRS